jgi:hypothetical protein
MEMNFDRKTWSPQAFALDVMSAIAVTGSPRMD